jgi:hypothetical protein
VHAAGVKVAARHRDREEIEDRSGVWHVVTATATALRDDPDAALAVPGVTFGTRLMALGAPFDGWLPVAVPGRFEPAWAIEDDVAAVPPAPPRDHADVLPWADRLRDVPHVWGGGSAFGVDGPGMVHLVWRRFASGAVNHVGFVAAPSEEAPVRPILHACDLQGRVVLESMPEHRAAALVGIGRVRF